MQAGTQAIVGARSVGQDRRFGDESRDRLLLVVEHGPYASAAVDLCGAQQYADAADRCEPITQTTRLEVGGIDGRADRRRGRGAHLTSVCVKQPQQPVLLDQP